MGFEAVRRTGKYWDDCNKLDSLINNYPFHTTGKTEKDFENGFASTLMAVNSTFNSNVLTQIDKASTVQSVYCFGKNHRPDMTLGENGIAIELKFVKYAGIREAIGQGFLYRLRYKFVFLLIVISEGRSEIYFDLDTNKEKDLHDTLQHLATNMNIFSYIVPAFNLKPGTKKCISFFK